MSTSEQRLQPAPAGPPAGRPRVWALLGARAGDNGQVLRLAAALGWPYAVKRLAYTAWHHAPNLVLGASRLSVDAAGSDALEPPWPDLVLAVGKRSVPAARWIRRRAGGRTRLVQIGRPRAPFAAFDLIVAPTQYRLPAAANVLHVTMPFGATAEEIAPSAPAWEADFAHLPRPLIGVLVGGDSPSFRLTAQAAGRLGRAVSAEAEAVGGGLLVTTSPRTPAAAAEALVREIRAPAFLARFPPPPGRNPLLGILAHADAFVVTGESASLLADACATGQPVRIFELPARWPVRAAQRWRAWRRRPAGAAPGRLAAALARRGLWSPPRDLDALHESLRARGLAAPLTAGLPGDLPAARRRRPGEEMEHAAAAVRKLVDAGAPTAAAMGVSEATA